MPKNTKTAFSTRFSFLLREISVTQTELSKTLGISKQTISAYSTGRSQPPVDMVVKISQMFNVSADWLLGLSGNDYELPSSTAKNTEIQSYGDLLRFLQDLQKSSGYSIDELIKLQIEIVEQYRNETAELKQLKDRKILSENLYYAAIRGCISKLEEAPLRKVEKEAD